MTAICLNCIVSGLVQGVFYRRAVCEQGKKRGLTGFVRNLPDGKVEAMLCGDKEKVMEMAKWLWIGSPASKVTNVETREIGYEEYDDFEIRY